MDILAVFAVQLMARPGQGAFEGHSPAKGCGGALDYFEGVESAFHAGYRLAARLVASFVALALFFVALDAAAPSEVLLAGPQPSLTPFSIATWSESIGR